MSGTKSENNLTLTYMTTSNVPIVITVSGVLDDLKNGLTRDEIGTKYGLNKTQVKDLFQHPKLKNKKTIKPKVLPFILEDDTMEETSTNQLSMQDELDATMSQEAVAESSEALMETEAIAETEVPAAPDIVEVPVAPAPAISTSDMREAVADAHTRRGVIIHDDTVQGAAISPDSSEAQW